MFQSTLSMKVFPVHEYQDCPQHQHKYPWYSNQMRHQFHLSHQLAQFLYRLFLMGLMHYFSIGKWVEKYTNCGLSIRIHNRASISIKITCFMIVNAIRCANDQGPIVLDQNIVCCQFYLMIRTEYNHSPIIYPDYT